MLDFVSVVTRRVGKVAGEQLIEHESQRVNVGGGGDGEAANLLRASELGREETDGVGGLEAGLGAIGEEKLGEAEIEQLGNAVGGDHDVGGLEVAMDDVGGVRILNGFADLTEEQKAGLEGEAVLIGIAG